MAAITQAQIDALVAKLQYYKYAVSFGETLLGPLKSPPKVEADTESKDTVLYETGADAQATILSKNNAKITLELEDVDQAMTMLAPFKKGDNLAGATRVHPGTRRSGTNQTGTTLFRHAGNAPQCRRICGQVLTSSVLEKGVSLMPTEKQIARVAKLLKKCRKYGLCAPPEFWAASTEELASIYNGAGPDWLPEWGRVVLTFFLWLFAAAFLIHDFRFDRSDRTEVGFATANSEMYANMMKINAAVFPRSKWYWRPFYDRWQVKAWAAYEACKLGGWSAWCDGTPFDKKGTPS